MKPVVFISVFFVAFASSQDIPPPNLGLICPRGFKINEEGVCSRVTRRCPADAVMVKGKCHRTDIFEQPTCPPGSIHNGIQCVPYQPDDDCQSGNYKVNGQCIPIPGVDPPEKTENYPTQTRCPSGFNPYNNQCYRCPQNFNLCEDRCVKSGQSCNSAKLPDIIINNYPRSQGTAGGAPNIVNLIEPINNTIININNITHPVTLHNLVENNIYIYNDVQCRDGSIRTVITKNNETINGCVDVDTEDDSEKTTSSGVEGSDDETPEKCCEVVTPRQCKQRDTNEWMCTHR